MTGLRVADIFMQFPWPSQTFAGINVRQLVAAGAEVRCVSLRPAHSEAAALMAERGLAGVPCTHASWGDLPRALAYALRHPLIVFGLSWRVLAWGLPSPRHVLAGCLVAPRALAAIAELEKWRPDVVHLYWGHYPCLVGWLVRRRLPGCVLSIGFVAYDIAHRYRGSRVMAGEAAVITTVAAVNRADLAAAGIESQRVEVVYDGLDPAMARRPSVAKVPGRVVIASRLTAPKGVDVAIRAFAAARARLPGLHLRILGDGPDRARLAALAAELGVADAVDFLGHVAHARVFAELDEAEAAILMSWSERLPNAVKEAMACGCIALSTRTPGIEELVEDGITGLLFDLGDAAGAGEALARVMADPALRQRIAAAGLVRIAERFDAAVSMRRLLALWQQAIERLHGAQA